MRPQPERETAGAGHRAGGALQSQAEPGEARAGVVGQAKRFSKEIAEGAKRAPSILKQLALEGLRQELDAMVPRVKQVMKQTRARIFRGDTRAEGKIVSLFEPSTEVIRKGKAGKPNEFGKMVKLQEAENQIVTDYEVYDQRPSDSDLLIAAIETIRPSSDARRAWWRRTPHSTPPRMRRQRKRAVSNGSAFPIAPPRAPSANANRRSAGSATARNGGPGARDASALSSDDTALTAADTRATPE